MKTYDIVVLYGGISMEREVSLSSGRGVAAALSERGHRVRLVDVTRDLTQLVTAFTPRPDVVFNILHGPFGEDGRIQGILDYIGVPYTFSGVLGSSVAMNKRLSKKLFIQAGLKIPQYEVHPIMDVLEHKVQWAYPYVVKPIDEGSSLGVYLVECAEDEEAIRDFYQKPEEVILEEYIAGTEVHVAIFKNRVFGTIETIPKNKFLDYECKYTPGMVQHIVPARLSPDMLEKVGQAACRAHQVLGCEGLSRVDLIVKESDVYILEVNTQPGMTATSEVPDIAKAQGMAFGELLEDIVQDALDRFQGQENARHKHIQ